MNEIAITIIIMLSLYATIINIVNHKSYSDFICARHNRNTKHRKPARLSLKEAKERYYPEYKYAVVNLECANYPLWLCKNIEDAKERVKYSCQSLYIVDLGDVR